MVNILFCGNYKVANGIELCLRSMIKHTNKQLTVFLLTADLTDINKEYRSISEEDRARFEKILKTKNEKSSVKLVNLGAEFSEWVKTSCNLLNKYTPYMFLRLFADKIDEIPSKILYLDTDMMINGDISTLYDIDMTGKELGVVLDRYGRWFINPRYFNSGMLLMNMDKIRETNLFDRVKEICLKKKMMFPDQTALNKCSKFKLYLPRKFNEQGNPRKDTVVQHFSMRIVFFPFHTVNIKPWHIEQVQNKYKIHNYDDVFEEYLKDKNK